MAIEKTVSVTSARNQLLKLTKQVARHMDRFVLTNKGEAEAVLLSVGEYKSLRAAAELAAHPEVITATLEGFERIKRGEGISLEAAFPQEANAGAAAAVQSTFRKKTNAAGPRSLDAREKKVTKMRFGLEDSSEHTLEKAGESFAVTRERIRQIEAKALRKLRHPSRSRQSSAER